MRVLQLIDSLTAGGAERMAVNLANELGANGYESFLCASREEGILKASLDREVAYLYLAKKSTLDLPALLKLYKFVKKHRVEIIHAHSSGFFWATLIKRLKPELRVIWHDHYGKSEQLKERKYGLLKKCSSSFAGIISVNELLKEWAENKLHSPQVKFIRNFVVPASGQPSSTGLKGTPDGRIICLANLRPQKDHLNLLAAYKLVKQQQPSASLHLIGGGSDSGYTESLRAFAASNDLQHVYFYGAQTGVQHLLKEAAIGVLSSNSEGLPVALLEYGIGGLAVVCTDVGQCRQVVGNRGKIVPPANSQLLAEALLAYLSNPEKAWEDAAAFKQHIEENYSFQAILPQLRELYSP